MVEFREYRIEIGFRRSPDAIFSEIERAVARFAREGWDVEDAKVDDLLGSVTIFFVRKIDL